MNPQVNKENEMHMKCIKHNLAIVKHLPNESKRSHTRATSVLIYMGKFTPSAINCEVPFRSWNLKSLFLLINKALKLQFLVQLDRDDVKTDLAAES